ncbi:hypothetical protein ACFL0V_05915 [Nanoarchaeota archaeon]
MSDKLSKVEQVCVEFLFGGSEPWTQYVQSRDPTEVDAPQGCYGFRFFDRNEVEVGDETLTGERRNVSSTHYFGVLTSIDWVKRVDTGHGLDPGDGADHPIIIDRHGKPHRYHDDAVVLEDITMMNDRYVQ